MATALGRDAPVVGKGLVVAARLPPAPIGKRAAMPRVNRRTVAAEKGMGTAGYEYGHRRVACRLGDHR